MYELDHSASKTGMSIISPLIIFKHVGTQLLPYGGIYWNLKWNIKSQQIAGFLLFINPRLFHFKFQYIPP